jgi:hypothetical protein
MELPCPGLMFHVKWLAKDLAKEEGKFLIEICWIVEIQTPNVWKKYLLSQPTNQWVTITNKLSFTFLYLNCWNSGKINFETASPHFSKINKYLATLKILKKN